MSGSNPKRASEDEIPILDAQSIVSNDNISLLAKSVREACQNMGFFYVKNHGISQIIIDDAFEASKRFFSEPIEKKMLVSKNKFHRGYLPIGTTRYPGKAADLKDSFDVLYKEGETSPKMMSVGLHCRIVGKPGRLKSLERFLDYDY